MAVLQNCVRDGNLALDAGDRDQISRRLGEVTGMLQILGLNADSPAWSRGSDDRALTTVVDGLVTELLDQRQAARARKDFATADAVRDTLARLGTITRLPQANLATRRAQRDIEFGRSDDRDLD